MLDALRSALFRPVTSVLLDLLWLLIVMTLMVSLVASVPAQAADAMPPALGWGVLDVLARGSALALAALAAWGVFRLLTVAVQALWCVPLVLVLVASIPAQAAEVLASAVDWSPLLNALVQVAALVLTALGSWVLIRLGLKADADRDKTRAEAEDITRAYLQDALGKAVHFGLQQEEARLKATPGTEFAPSRVVEDAAGYAVRQAPDALKHFGITPDRVRDMLVARLPLN